MSLVSVRSGSLPVWPSEDGRVVGRLSEAVSVLFREETGGCHCASPRPFPSLPRFAPNAVTLRLRRSRVATGNQPALGFDFIFSAACASAEFTPGRSRRAHLFLHHGGSVGSSGPAIRDFIPPSMEGLPLLLASEVSSLRQCTTFPRAPIQAWKRPISHEKLSADLGFPSAHPSLPSSAHPSIRLSQISVPFREEPGGCR